MNAVMNRILNFEYNCTRVILLRLCKKSNHVIWVNHVRIGKTSNAFQKLPEHYNYFLPPQKYMSTETNKQNESDIIPEEHSVLLKPELIHSMLRNSVHYKNTIMPAIKTIPEITQKEIDELYVINWDTEKPLVIYNAIKKLSYCYLRGSRFDQSLYETILNASINHLDKLDDNQLKILMQHLIVLVDTLEKQSLRRMLLNELDKECINRFYHTNTEQMLLIVDAFHQLQFLNSKFIWRAIRKLCGKPVKLKPHNLVQVMFIVHTYYLKSVVNFFTIQEHANNCILHLGGNDIGIIAQSFCSMKKSITYKPLFDKLMYKLVKNVQYMHDVAIIPVMRLIRYSTPTFYDQETFHMLTRSLYPQLSKLTVTCLVHILGAYTTFQIYDERLIKHIFERIKNNMDSVTLKGIAMFLYAVWTVTPDTSEYQNIYKVILNELTSTYWTTRSVEINRNQSLPRIVMLLLLKGVYEPRLLDYIRSDEFMTNVYRSRRNYSRELLCLHCTLEIMTSNDLSPFFDEDTYKFLWMKHSPNVAILKKKQGPLLQAEVISICKNKLRIDACAEHILPHFHYEDIVFGFDELEKPTEIESILSAMPSGSIKRVDNDEGLKKINWKVLFLIFKNQKVQGHNGYIGEVYNRWEQLKAIGYTPLPVCENKWRLYVTDEEKESYLRDLIYGNSNDKLLNVLVS